MEIFPSENKIELEEKAFRKGGFFVVWKDCA